jgi:hypothetical protein
MKPFDEYPGKGIELLGRVKGANCRHEYGLKFMKQTGQTKCAYCGLDFTESYNNWVTMALDHVIPASVCKTLDIKIKWSDDSANKVLACSACNSYCNRYKPEEQLSKLESEVEFFKLRDEIFEKRKAKIDERRQQEIKFFNAKHWLDK